MLHQHLITTPAPPLDMEDTVESALAILEDLKVHHWPVVSEQLYKGIISEDSLLEASTGQTMADLLYELQPLSITTEEHFLAAARLMSERRLSVLPVITAGGEYVGVILTQDLLNQLSKLTGSHTQGGIIVLEMDPLDFSPGEINRLVETNDAQIRQLNTQIDEVTGRYLVTIRINKQEISDIIATLQRYDYRVAYFVGEEQYENELNRNYQHLLHFIEM